MINYLMLGNSVDFYEKKGYTRIEAPWWVPVDIMNITLPLDKDPSSSIYFLPKNNKSLVYSGEQSLLYLANQGLLPKGKYQTITPCFRDDTQGIFHRKFFMKNELMIAHSKAEKDLKKVIKDAYSFFKFQVPDKKLLKIVETLGGFDIEYNGIEIGSYGIRTTSFLDWVYGTGVAEPRFSIALESVKTK